MDLRAIRRMLIQALPPRHPVKVRRCKLPDGDLGDCALIGDGEDRRFHIRIHRDLGDVAALFVLAHEWAHALSWGRDREDHGDAWARAHARVWRVIADDVSDVRGRAERRRLRLSGRALSLMRIP